MCERKRDGSEEEEEEEEEEGLEDADTWSGNG